MDALNCHSAEQITLFIFPVRSLGEWAFNNIAKDVCEKNDDLFNSLSGSGCDRLETDLHYLRNSWWGGEPCEDSGRNYSAQGNVSMMKVPRKLSFQRNHGTWDASCGDWMVLPLSFESIWQSATNAIILLNLLHDAMTNDRRRSLSATNCDNALLLLLVVKAHNENDHFLLVRASESHVKLKCWEMLETIAASRVQNSCHILEIKCALRETAFMSFGGTNGQKMRNSRKCCYQFSRSSRLIQSQFVSFFGPSRSLTLFLTVPTTFPSSAPSLIAQFNRFSTTSRVARPA